MYERKIPLDSDCGVSIAIEVVLSKWKYCILSEIDKGTIRPKDLVNTISGITKRVLHQQLKQLEYYKFVNRITYAEVPLRVEYSLTKSGREVLPLLTQVHDWGINFAPQLKEIEDSEKNK